MSTSTTNNLEMTENSLYILNTTNLEDDKIQSSAFINQPDDLNDDGVGLIRISSNNLDARNNADMINDTPSRRSSKIRFYSEKEKDEKGYYSGNMERFFQSEVRPVYFGDKNDALLLLEVTIIASLLVNLFGILVYMQYDDLIPQNPSEHHPHSAFLRLLSAFESALSAYYSDGQIVVGWMLGCWFFGYNVISGVIWWQFERREVKIPDDYEIIPSNRLRHRTGSNISAAVTNNNNNNNNNNFYNNPLINNTIEIGDRLISRDSFRKLTKAQKQKNLHQSDHPHNSPFDKSVVVISMPNGDFAVGKRQKLFFN